MSTQQSAPTRRSLAPAAPSGPARPTREGAAAANTAAATDKAARYASAPKAAAGGFDLPAGEYEATILSMEFQNNDKGESIQVEYTIVGGEHDSKTCKAWYNLFDESGAELEGLGYWNRDKEVFGIPDHAYEELPTVLEAYASEHPACVLNVRKKTVNKQTYTNIFLKGMI